MPWDAANASVSLHGVKSRGWMTCGRDAVGVLPKVAGVRRSPYEGGALSCLILGVGDSIESATLAESATDSDLRPSSFFAFGSFLDFVTRFGFSLAGRLRR